MRALLVAAVLVLGGAAPSHAARPGTLDRSFGGDGRVETRVAGGEAAVAGVEVLRSGRILAVGTVGTRRVVLLRYRRSGRLDRRFGRGGVASLDLGGEVNLGAVSPQPDGRLLVAGGLGPELSPDRVAFVARLSPAGALDSSFSDGGIVRTDFGGSAGDTVTDLALGPAGEIVATAAIDHGQGQPPPQPSTSHGDLGVARYDSRGSLDRSFGRDGLVRIDAASEEELTPGAVALQDGRILIGGNHTGLRSTAPFALRLLADGAPDLGFGSAEGRFYLPGDDDASISDLVLEPVSGDVLLAGFGYLLRPAFYLAELPREPPAPDAAKKTYVPAADRDLYGQALTLDRRGRRIVGGSVWGPGFDSERSVFGVARLLRGGRADRCFGRGGLARVAFRYGPSTLGDLDLDGRGRIVAAGPSDSFGAQPRAPGFQLIRLHGGRCRRR